MPNGEQAADNVLEARYNALKTVLAGLQKNTTLTNETERKKHFQQLVLEIQTDVRDLAKRLNKTEELAAASATLHQVVNPPAYVQNDSRLFKAVKNALQEKSREHVRPPLVVESPGGGGKSLLAARLAHDETVRLAFPDGIFWLSLGMEPDIITLQNRLNRSLGNDAAIIDIEAGSEHLKKVCENRACLFILDDVWEIQDILTFNLGGKNNQLLITTSHPDLFEFVKYSLPNAQGYTIEALSETDAQALFLNVAGQPKLDDLNVLVMVGELTKLCEYNPQAIRLLAGAARDQLPANWEMIRDNFEAAEPEEPEGDHSPILLRALQVALDALGEEADYYLSLAVFDRHLGTPQAAAVMLWQYLYKLQEKQAHNLLVDFAERGLLHLSGDPMLGDIYLQEFQKAYLHTDPDLDKLHVHLLTAYNRRCLSGWLSGPNDGYFYQYLCRHLNAAKRYTELKSLLLDFEWLHKKIQTAGVHSLPNDYEYLNDEAVLQVKQALIPDGHPIPIRNAEHLADMLFDSLWEQRKDSKDIAALLNQAREILPDWEPPYPDQGIEAI